MTRKLGVYQFEFVAEVHPATDGAGKIVEYVHRLPRGIQPNRYASGPFCKFELEVEATGPGVYAITLGNDIKYVGETENLPERFGPKGYGYIAARNCHGDGQATNCKINSIILRYAKLGHSIKLWFHQTRHRKAVESELIAQLRPPWNGRVGSTKAHRYPALGPAQPAATADAFREALERELARATRLGLRSVRIRAGDLHHAVGGYPSTDHRMPLCCQIMIATMRQDDRILESPPSSTGANLTVEFRLPRYV